MDPGSASSMLPSRRLKASTTILCYSKPRLPSMLIASHTVANRKKGIGAAVGPHATDTVSENLWNVATDLAKNVGAVLFLNWVHYNNSLCVYVFEINGHSADFQYTLMYHSCPTSTRGASQKTHAHLLSGLIELECSLGLLLFFLSTGTSCHIGT